MKFNRNQILFVLLLLWGTAEARTGLIQRGYLQRQDVQEFIQSVHQKHGIPVTKIAAFLSPATQQTRVLELIAKPAEGKPWSKYRPIFLTDKRIDAGEKFWEKNAVTLKRASEAYGVPEEIIVAIIGVETFYGTRMGGFSVLDTLVSLGFDYPPRSAFFLSELEHLILLADEESLDPHKLKGSYAGAMGMGQFISSSYRNFAIDFDADGDRDLFTSTEDAIGSVANYFQQHDWQTGKWVISQASVTGQGFEQLDANNRKPQFSAAQLKAAGVYSKGPLSANEQLVYLKLEGASGIEHWVGHHNFYVITQYNHSVKYALAVFQLAEAIKNKRNIGH